MTEKYLEEIYNEHYRPLCFYAAKYVKDIEEARDIAQDVFVELWQRGKDFPDATALKAYLYTAVYNACMNHIKLADIHNRHHDHIRQTTSEADERNYLTDRIEAETMWELMSAIDSLPEECRKVFKLSYMEGLDIQEVADRLRLSAHTVKSQRARAKLLLRDRLKDLFPLFACLFLQ